MVIDWGLNPEPPALEASTLRDMLLIGGGGRGSSYILSGSQVMSDFV